MNDVWGGIDDDALAALEDEAMARGAGSNSGAATDLLHAATDLFRQHWGHDELKPNQRAAIRAVLEQRDCLVIAPTGGGKSVCFQIPPLVTRKPAVVVSPLVALMQDQVTALQLRDIKAVMLGSAQTDSSAEERALAGEFSLVYVTPEKAHLLLHSC